MTWRGMLSLLLFYMVSSWGLLYLSAETALIAPELFFYWLMVTTSTVGYGDFSPQTFAGRLVVAIYIIPVGLSLFAFFIGRIVGLIVDQWQLKVRGYKRVTETGHILIVGWREHSTQQMISLLHQEAQINRQRKIVLCVDKEMQNPSPDKIDFVRVSSFSAENEMQRANLAQAETIIVCAASDDVTFTTALFCQKRNPTAHMIAWFDDERLGDLLKEHCAHIEIAPSLHEELMVKAAMDPGSIQLHLDLLSIETPMTQFSTTYSATQVSFETLFYKFKNDWQATLIAVKTPIRRKC